MIICWDNLQDLRFRKTSGTWVRSNTIVFFYQESCKACGEPFLSTFTKSKFCSLRCRSSGKNNSFYGKQHSKETIERMSKNKKGEKSVWYGKHHSEETKKKMSRAASGKQKSNSQIEKMISSKKGRGCGKDNPNWKGGVSTRKLASYKEYYSKLSWCEPVRQDPEDEHILQVKCAYCGKWFSPSSSNVFNRLFALDNSDIRLVENRFYCSNECKYLCPTFKQKIKYKFQKGSYTREVQAELRQLVFERDNWTCTKCNSIKSLHCHHIEGIRWEPLESADMDKCITLCKTCHEEVHEQEGCGYRELGCNKDE